DARAECDRRVAHTFVVGGDENGRQRGGGPRGLVNVREERPPSEIGEHLSGEPRGCVAGGNDTDDDHRTLSTRRDSINTRGGRRTGPYGLAPAPAVTTAFIRRRFSCTGL